MSNRDGMQRRGVTRPMASGDGGDDHHQKLADHHRQTLWCYWLVILLGGWTIAAPLTFGYGTDIATLERSVWLSLDARVTAMTWSDIISGALLVVFGWRTLTPNRPYSRWICCGVGIWLTFAPLIFWAPTSAAYLNDTIVGALVIALTILIPGMPNMILYMKMGDDRPPGWTYNPSSWPQRGVIIVLGFAGWLTSRYLAAYQLGYIDQIWDPFFGQGSEKVLSSQISHMWPISDAGLAALSYTFEFLMGWMGAPTRWRTMPWMVTFFGLLVIPLGLTHILLVISQPVIVGRWCTLCLAAAAIMLPMLPLEVDEVIAMGQHVRRRVRAGEPFWQVFWKGGTPETNENDRRTPDVGELPDRPAFVTSSAFWGMSWSWWLATAAAIGVGLMFAPAAFGYTGTTPATIHHLGGALVVTTSIIAMGEPVRRGRHLNLFWSVVIGIGPWMFGDIGLPAQLMSTVAALLVIILSLPRGPKKDGYGRWDQYVK
ncbi:MAG: vitamin K epoxide reductase family protein [Bradymonadaceae bacterium]